MLKRTGRDRETERLDSHIRHTAGKLREQISFVECGIEKELSLVAIPVIVSFKEIVPTSHFEAAMLEFNSAGSSVNYLKEIDAQVVQLKLFPQLFLLDELMTIPLSSLKRRCVSLHSEIGNGRNRAQTWERPEHGQKRATMFLRYLVGCQNATKSESWFEQAITCARLEEATMCILKRNIGRECIVSASYTSSFHEAVYAGMWRYQIEQLDYVSRNVWSATGRRHQLCAKVALQGDGHQFGLTVGFFLDDRLINGRNYLLRTRPEENAMRCLHRVKRRIEASGICTIAQEKFIPWGAGHVKVDREGYEIPALSLPI